MPRSLLKLLLRDRSEESGAGTERSDIRQTARRDLRGGRPVTGGPTSMQKD